MKIILVGIWLTLGSDAASTTYGINHRMVKEVLIPSQNVYVIDGVVAAEGVGITTGLNQLNKNHPKLAKIVGVGLIVVRSTIVMNNVEQLRKR